MNPEWETLLRDFIAVQWSACAKALSNVAGRHVYALVVEANGRRFPLYIGQTRRLLGRVGDYQVAQFQAPTDFRVGEAIRYFSDRKHSVTFMYKQTEFHLKDEKALIRELLLNGCMLLNFLGSFDYNNASVEDERKLVHRFCEMALAQTDASI